MNFEQYQFPSRRSAMMGQNGMVATSQPLAAQVGLRVLQAGGNAVDAAIAAVATLCVVEPCSTGIGGDAFALIWMADEGKLVGLNASGPAPQNITADFIRQQGHATMPQKGGLTVTVPGSLRGWQLALDRYGSLGLDTLLTPAIDYANDGYPVSQRIAAAWHKATTKMSQHPDSKRVWLPNGRSPRAGHPFQNPEFAQTLQTIADQGVDAFYHGHIAQQIVDCVQADGGTLTLDDLAAYQAEWVNPISANYGDYTLYEIPPNSQGLTALLALNIAQGFDLQSLGYGTADYYHALIEATKLAFADAQTYIADPKQVNIPLQGLLADSYTQSRRALIQPHQALMPTPGQPHQHGETVYLSVADAQGNMVSWIQSLYEGFGSGLTAGTTGIQLQNRGANFSLEAGHLNEIAPGKRPYHTIIPAFITKGGQPWCSFGVMGGFMQPQGHLQVGLNLMEFGMDPQTALDAPRFRWLKEKVVSLETAVSPTTQQTLAQYGHQRMPPDGLFFGGGQVIIRDPDTGILIGGSEPRNDGTAVAF